MQSSVSTGAVKDYARIVILGDPHLPGRNFHKKCRVIDDVNRWNDVELVVSVGDVCAGFGTEREYEFARNFFSRLKKPFLTLIGNHDSYYSDAGFIPAGIDERRKKIARFISTFAPTPLYFSRLFNGVKLIFLALDCLESSYFSAVSREQLQWFASELAADRETATVVFCHAPLWSKEVLAFFPQAINYIVQPADEFNRIVRDNPQIRLWVSGHVHFGMVKELVKHPFNIYEQQVLNILNCDMDGFSVIDRSIRPQFHKNIWTRSLFLNAEGFRCTVFNHDSGEELPELEVSSQFGRVPAW